jgi:hypothetical protein
MDFLRATDEGVLLVGDDFGLYELAFGYWNCRCCVSFVPHPVLWKIGCAKRRA